MSKHKYSAVDCAAIAESLRYHIGGLWFQNCYQLASNNRSISIKLSRPGMKTFLVIESGFRLYSSNYQHPASSKIKAFCTLVKQKLKSKRLLFVRQIGIDRVICFTFGRGSWANHLIVELYGRGNILLLDQDFVVIGRMRKQISDSESPLHARYKLESTQLFTPMSVDLLNSLENPSSPLLGELLRKFAYYGNILHKEMLFRAKIDPQMTVTDFQKNTLLVQSLVDQYVKYADPLFCVNQDHVDLRTLELKKGYIILTKPPQAKKKKAPVSKNQKKIIKWTKQLESLKAKADPTNSKAISSLEEKLNMFIELEKKQNSADDNAIASASFSSETKSPILSKKTQHPWITPGIHKVSPEAVLTQKIPTDEQALFQSLSSKHLSSFYPYLPLKYDPKEYPILEFQYFVSALDAWYTKMDSEKLEKSRIQKLDHVSSEVKKTHTRLDQQLAMLKADADFFDAASKAFRDSIQTIDGIFKVLQSALNEKMDWNVLIDYIKTENQRNNPFSLSIASLDLSKPAARLWIPNPNHPSYPNSKPTGLVDFDPSTPLPKMGLSSQKKLLRKQQGKDPDLVNFDPTIDEFFLINVDLSHSCHKNLTDLFANSRLFLSKFEKTQSMTSGILNKSRKGASEQASKLKSQAKGSKLFLKRTPFWFEKFFWSISSENYVIVGGRDKSQNELLVSKYLGPNDVYFHAQIHGAASCIVKNPFKSQPIPSTTLREAAVFALCRSTAWDEKTIANVFWVNSSQVSKVAESGEYLPSGSFMIRGKKNFIPVTSLELGFGLLFQIDPISYPIHANDRVPQFDNNSGATFAEEQQESRENVNDPNKIQLNKQQRRKQKKFEKDQALLNADLKNAQEEFMDDQTLDMNSPVDEVVDAPILNEKTPETPPPKPSTSILNSMEKSPLPQRVFLNKNRRRHLKSIGMTQGTFYALPYEKQLEIFPSKPLFGAKTPPSKQNLTKMLADPSQVRQQKQSQKIAKKAKKWSPDDQYVDEPQKKKLSKTAQRKLKRNQKKAERSTRDQAQLQSEKEFHDFKFGILQEEEEEEPNINQVNDSDSETDSSSIISTSSESPRPQIRNLITFERAFSAIGFNIDSPPQFYWSSDISGQAIKDHQVEADNENIAEENTLPPDSHDSSTLEPTPSSSEQSTIEQSISIQTTQDQSNELSGELLYKKAKKLERQSKFEKALHIFQQSAAKDYLPAIHSIASFYSGNKGIQKDSKKVIEYLSKAANAGFPESQFRLGMRYFLGHEVEQNKPLGIEWFTKAANQHHTQAQFALGQSFSSGAGCPENQQSATKWFLAAAVQGHQESQNLLSLRYAKGIGVTANPELAAEWKARSESESTQIDLEQVEPHSFLVSNPRLTDVVINVIPVCAPWITLQNYSKAVKLVPGTLKRSVVIQKALSWMYPDTSDKHYISFVQHISASDVSGILINSARPVHADESNRNTSKSQSKKYRPKSKKAKKNVKNHQKNTKKHSK